MILLSSNNASTTLAAGISSSATTILLATGTGALFPLPGANEYFTLTLNDIATGQLYEICNCTARTGDSLTVTRGQEGTSARAWLLGDLAYNTETANSIQVARAYAAGNAPGLPFTILAAHQGIVQYCGATGTITLPATGGIQDGFLCPIVCTSSSATITVNTNSASVVLPSGIVTGTFTLSGPQASITLQWNASASVWFMPAAPNAMIGPASVGGDLTVNGTTFFGTSGQFYANPNNGGDQLINFAASNFLQFTPGTGFSLVIGGLVAVVAPAGLNVTGPGSFSGAVGIAQGTAAGEAVRLDQFSSSLGSRGWKEYADPSSPTGYYLEQWGTDSTGDAVPISFPKPFPNTVLNIVISEAAAGSGTWGAGNPTVHAATFLSLTQFTHWTLSWSSGSWVGGTNTCSWRAIGY